MFTVPQRSSSTVTREVAGEFVVLDTATGTAHSLTGSAAEVWRAAGTTADVDRNAIDALAEAGLLGRSGVSRRALLKRGGTVAAAVGVASIALPMASAAASVTTDLVLDLFTEVASYNAAHITNVASNISGQFAYFRTNGSKGTITFTGGVVPGTALSYTASSGTNGKWSSGGNVPIVGPFGSTPFNSVTVTPNNTNGGGNGGQTSVVQLTIPSAPSGVYSGTGTLNVHATLTGGTDGYVYILDSSGAQLNAPIHLTTGSPTTNTTINIPQGAANQKYYVVVADGDTNGTATNTQLDVTATLPHT